MRTESRLEGLIQDYLFCCPPPCISHKKFWNLDYSVVLVAESISKLCLVDSDGTDSLVFFLKDVVFYIQILCAEKKLILVNIGSVLSGLGKVINVVKVRLILSIKNLSCWSSGLPRNVNDVFFKVLNYASQLFSLFLIIVTKTLKPDPIFCRVTSRSVIISSWSVVMVDKEFVHSDARMITDVFSHMG